MSFILVGNYGVGNLGDELLRESFLKLFPDVEWVAVSAHPAPGELPRLPGGIRSLFSFRWLRTMRAIKESDGVVFGGGSLFTDAESVRACFVWVSYALIASIYHKKILLAFQGMGPYRSRMGEGIARWVVRKSAYISVRDSLSSDRIKMWKKSTEVIQTSDPVFLSISKQKNDTRIKNVFVSIPRKNSDAMYRKMHNEKLKSTEWQETRIVLLEPDDPQEIALGQELCRDDGSRAVLFPVHTLRELQEALMGATSVLTQRYHGAVAALALGVPEVISVPQRTGDKIDTLRQIAARQGGVAEQITLAQAGVVSLQKELSSL